MIVLPQVTFDTVLLNHPGSGGDLNDGDNGANATKHFYALDDDSCVVIADAKLRTWPFRSVWIYVLDYSGAYTWYALNYLQAAYGYINTIQVLGPGRFLITLSDAGGAANQTFYCVVANKKLNNASPIPIFPGATTLTNPCYNTNPHVYYDAAQGILAAGFYNPGGGFGGPVYSSNYRVQASGSLSLLAQGYVGNFTVNGYDPWDQTGGKAPGAGPYKTGTSGTGVACSVGVPGTGYWLGYNAYRVNPGLNSGCGTPSGASVSSYGSGVIYSTFTLNEPFFVESTIPGVRGLATWGNQQMQLLLDNGLRFLVPFNSTISGVTTQTMVITRKWIFANAYQNGYYNAVVRASLPAGWNLYTPNSVAKNKYGLVNFVRPVSVIGKYKA